MNSTFTGYQVTTYRWNNYFYSVSCKVRDGSVVSTAVYRWDYISDEEIQEIQTTGCSSTAVQCADVSQLLRIFGEVISTKTVRFLFAPGDNFLHIELEGFREV